jgi:hypothetical protein
LDERTVERDDVVAVLLREHDAGRDQTDRGDEHRERAPRGLRHEQIEEERDQRPDRDDRDRQRGREIGRRRKVNGGGRQRSLRS